MPPAIITIVIPNAATQTMAVWRAIKIRRLEKLRTDEEPEQQRDDEQPQQDTRLVKNFLHFEQS
jgi:hypothetical protein